MALEESVREREERLSNKRRKIFLIFLVINILLPVSLFASLYWAFDVSLEHSIIWSVSLLILLFLICFIVIYFTTFSSRFVNLNKKYEKYKKYREMGRQGEYFNNNKNLRSYAELLDRLYYIDNLIKKLKLDISNENSCKKKIKYLNLAEKLKNFSFKYHNKLPIVNYINPSIKDIEDFLVKNDEYNSFKKIN